jgi:hypothetical protein
MHSDRTYTLRQAVLQTGRDFYPAPFGIDDLEADPRLQRHHATRDELVAVHKDLLAYGYLLPVPESNGALVRASSDGIAQINGDATRDAAIWGRYAL